MKTKVVLYSALMIAVVLGICVLVHTRSEATPPKIITADKGIAFIEDDWTKAMAQAKAQNKLIFIDIYAVWCGPCKMLKAKTFTDEKVGDFFNKTFVNISIDGEKGVGPTLAQKYSLQGYPTLIVTDATGKPVLYTMGYIDPNTLMQFAQAALNKKQP